MKRRELDREDLEIVQWAMLPTAERDANPLPRKKQERYERANVADNLRRIHLSRRKVLERLMDKFQHSETSARRDIRLAEGLWGSNHKLAKDYMGDILLDFAMDSLVAAAKDRKWDSVARLLKETRELAGIGKPDPEDDAGDEQLLPSTVVPAYLPESIGAVPLTNEDREAAYKRILAQKVRDGYLDKSTVTEFEEPDDGAQAQD